MSEDNQPQSVRAKACDDNPGPLRVVLTRIGESPPYPCGGERWMVDTPERAFAFWGEVVSKDASFEADKEHLVAILVDAKLRTSGYHVVSVGSLNEAIAHPREIFRAAIVAGAYGLVLMHNHPSGDPNPSSADRHITRTIREAADILQLRFLDHVIAGRGTYYSFNEAGASE